jgi:integrase
MAEVSKEANRTDFAFCASGEIMSLKLVDPSVNVPAVEAEKPKRWESFPDSPGLLRDRRDGTYYIRGKQKGLRPLFESTHEKKKGKAKTAAKLIVDAWQKKTPAEYKSRNITFGEYAPEALKSWLALPEDKFRKRSKENAQMYIDELVIEIGYARLSDITTQFIMDWVTEFQQRKKRRKTFRDYVSYISKTLRHAKRSGVLSSVPEFVNPDPKKVTGRVYTRAEMTALLNLAAARVAYWRGDACMLPREMPGNGNAQQVMRSLAILAQLRCCFNGMMRMRECICAPWSELDLETGKWTLPKERVKTGSKTGQGREFYLPEKPLALLRQIYKAKDPECPWMFPNPRDPSRPIWSNKSAWKAIKKQAGVLGKARWHDLRHTALTFALVGDDQFQVRLQMLSKEEQDKIKREELVNPLLVSKYAGTNIRTIEAVYLKVKAEHTSEVRGAISL